MSTGEGHRPHSSHRLITSPKSPLSIDENMLYEFNEYSYWSDSSEVTSPSSLPCISLATTNVSINNSSEADNTTGYGCGKNIENKDSNNDDVYSDYAGDEYLSSNEDVASSDNSRSSGLSDAYERDTVDFDTLSLALGSGASIWGGQESNLFTLGDKSTTLELHYNHKDDNLDTKRMPIDGTISSSPKIEDLGDVSIVEFQDEEAIVSPQPCYGSDIRSPIIDLNMGISPIDSDINISEDLSFSLQVSSDNGFFFPKAERYSDGGSFISTAREVLDEDEFASFLNPIDDTLSTDDVYITKLPPKSTCTLKELKKELVKPQRFQKHVLECSSIPIAPIPVTCHQRQSSCMSANDFETEKEPANESPRHTNLPLLFSDKNIQLPLNPIRKAGPGERASTPASPIKINEFYDSKESPRQASPIRSHQNVNRTHDVINNSPIKAQTTSLFLNAGMAPLQPTKKPVHNNKT